MLYLFISGNSKKSIEKNFNLIKAFLLKNPSKTSDIIHSFNKRQEWNRLYHASASFENLSELKNLSEISIHDRPSKPVQLVILGLAHGVGHRKMT